MDLGAASAAGLPAQTAGLLTVAFVALAARQRIDDWLAPKGFVKLVIPGKQRSSDDSDTTQNATMMFYARFPELAPSDHTARQASFKSTKPHLIVYIAVTHFDTMPLYKGEKLLLSRNGGTPQTCWRKALLLDELHRAWRACRHTAVGSRGEVAKLRHLFGLFRDELRSNMGSWTGVEQ